MTAHIPRKSQPAKVLLRMPASLYEAIKVRAEIEGVSINQVIVYMLSGVVRGGGK